MALAATSMTAGIVSSAPTPLEDYAASNKHLNIGNIGNIATNPTLVIVDKGCDEWYAGVTPWYMWGLSYGQGSECKKFLQATAKKHASSIRANWWHPSTWEWGLTRVAAGEVERETAARAQCTKYQDKCNGPPTASAERTPGAFCATVKAVAAVEYALTTWQRPAEAFADQILPVGSLFCADVIFDLFGANGLGAYFMYEYETRCYEWYQANVAENEGFFWLKESFTQKIFEKLAGCDADSD